MTPVRAVLLAALLTSASGVHASETVLWRRLDSAGISERFVGRTMSGRYNNGTHLSEHMRGDGTTFYEDDERTTDGAYEVRDDMICFAYPVPMDTGCFIVWQRSQNCFDFYIDPAEGFPAASAIARAVGTGWDSRVSVDDSEPTCPREPMS